MPAYAVSFLKDAPLVESSKTVVGWLPATATGTAHVNETGEAEAEAGLQDFVPNGAHPSFLSITHM